MKMVAQTLDAARSNGSDGNARARLHDLRHSFASLGVGGEMGLRIIGKLVGHAQASTTSMYAHLGTDLVRRASDRIGATIAAALGEPTSTTEKVTRIERNNV